MTIRYDAGYDPRYERPRPRPRTPAEQLAVEQLMTTGCRNPRGPAPHLIPATSTICLRCCADANDFNRLETTQ